MKLHLLGLPHTVTDDLHTHCAFTQKVRRFGPMMRREGFEVIHYGNEGSDSGANEEVVILGTDEHLALLGQSSYYDTPAQFVGDRTKNGKLFDRFNMILREQLQRRLEPGDMICLPFGGAHDEATAALPAVRNRQVLRVETGIGYPDPVTLNRIYESEAWRHWTAGKEQRTGAGWNSPRFEAVIPNYYEVLDWPFRQHTPSKTVVFFGRINEAKGCQIIPILAKQRPDLRFVMCGQGDPAPYLTEPNVSYEPPRIGAERALFLGRASVALFPSRFIEPFCGGAVEAMLCGTPVLTPDFGAFTETNIDGMTGFRCRTEREWLEKIDQAMDLDRFTVSCSARDRFSTEEVGPKYTKVFAQLSESLADGRMAKAAT